MKIEEIREKNAEELREMCAHAQEQLRALRFDACTKTLAQVHRIAEARKEIAQMLTVLCGRYRVS